jgi:hypothetical protein
MPRGPDPSVGQGQWPTATSAVRRAKPLNLNMVSLS